MDTLWIVLGIIFIVAGIAGCFLPILPGPPLAYGSLLFLQLTKTPPFTTKFLVIWAFVILFVTVFDYVIPPYATKKFGGSRHGVIGSSIGIVAGLFIFPPWGIIIFPFIGALIGEFYKGKDQKDAFRAAFGSFIGFVTGVLMKLTVSIIITWYFFTNLV